MLCNERPSQATANPVSGKACSSTKGGLLRYIPNTYSIHKVSSLKFAYFQGRLPVTYITSPPRRLVPSLGLGTTWVRQPRSGGCHHPTAATKCNERPSQATANPVSGKACSSTKGGLLHYIPNTYSIHKVSSLKFAYFQGRLPVTFVFQIKDFILNRNNPIPYHKSFYLSLLPRSQNFSLTFLEGEVISPYFSRPAGPLYTSDFSFSILSRFRRHFPAHIFS